MTNFKKHVGRIRNTDRRCVVAYMQIPAKEDHALIIDTDALPDRFHDALMSIIDSHEGQSITHLHTLLARRILPDLGVDMMNALHSQGFLRSIPIDEVIMYPTPHSPCPLRTIIEYMGDEIPVTDENVELQNRHLENQKAQQKEVDEGPARSLLTQAQYLEAEAVRKREQAYRLAPQLRPSSESDSSISFKTPVGYTETPVEIPTEPTVSQEASLVEPVVVSDVDTLDIGDLPADVAAAYLESIKVGFFESINEGVEEPAHAVDVSESSVQDFLDRAAAREMKANKEALDASMPKRPVGRPRHDGAPAGSVSKARTKAKTKAKAKGAK